MGDREEKGKAEKKQPVKRLLLRLLAGFLALVLILELGIPSVTQVSFSSDKFDEGMKQNAAKLVTQMEEYLNQSNLGQGVTYARAKTNDEKYESYAAKASVAIGQEKYAEAAEYLGKCLEVYEGDEEETLLNLHLKRAGLYILCEENEKALPELDSVLALDPDHSDALYLRIQLYVEKENYKAAAADALAYEACGDMDGETLTAFAGIYDMAEDTDNALRLYDILLADSQTATTALLAARARLRLLKEDVTGATEDLEAYFVAGGEDEDGEKTLLLCGCYLQAEQYEKAKTAYELALEAGAQPKTDMKNWMALALLSLEDYEGSLTLLEQVLAEDEDYAGAAYLKGLCLYGLKKYEEAIASFTASLALEQEAMNSLYYRGLSYLLWEKYEEAEEDFKIVAADETCEMAESAAGILKLLEE